MSGETGYRPASVRSADIVYGPGGPALDDPAEAYHEASSAYPVSAARDGRGARLLETSPELRATARRSVKRHPEFPAIPLPPPAVLARPLGDALSTRRSIREYSRDPVAGGELAALLHAAYGVTAYDEAGTSPALRAAPSGGALFPLELYALALNVTDLDVGLYHFDPLVDELECEQDDRVVEPILESMIYRAPVEQAAVVLVLTAMFWRTRFKYALRGYRFALLEAGHVAQNVLLAATALGLASVPLGGFFDRKLATALGIDGVNEAPLYLVCVGRGS